MSSGHDRTATAQASAAVETHQPSLFSYTPYRSFRSPAPFLPMSRAEMDALGWDACDIVLVTGDAYVDHPSFGMAIIGRLLEAQGFRVGIIAQPDWQSAEPFKALGEPNLFFGVTGGNMDSMVNRYTADRRLRHNDSYTPGGEGGKRPDRSRHRLRAALPRGLSRTCRSCSAASRRRCGASRTTTTGRTRCAARSWPTPRPTSCSTATPSARSSRSRIASPRASAAPRSTTCAASR